ncbi:hypothetical protein WQE_49538 [Paraburkholderia hospita]|uniref:Uncharacterized protein n=1 Tax=Paraburkholderia hospita TaxID=169430 RepID=A0ABN0F4D1_9BURK|nr:hypothetical protein WQE_49538 [Paraburkholderia hospita]
MAPFADPIERLVESAKAHCEAAFMKTGEHFFARHATCKCRFNMLNEFRESRGLGSSGLRIGLGRERAMARRVSISDMGSGCLNDGVMLPYKRGKSVMQKG